MCGENTLGRWATLAGAVLLLGLIVTTLLVNILGGGGDAEEVMNLGQDSASIPTQVFQEEQSGGISMFNLHLPTAIGGGLLVILVLILLYLAYRRMQKRQLSLARNGRREMGDERELNVLYSAPAPPPYAPMRLQNPVTPSWMEGWRAMAPTMAVAPMAMPPTYPAIHPPSIPDRSTSLPMEELIRRNETQREEATNSAFRNALNSDERRANSLIQGALRGD